MGARFILVERLLAFVAFAMLGNVSAWALSRTSTPELSVELLSDKSVLAPGGTHQLALRFKMQKYWHVYWRNPGDSGTQPQIKVQSQPELKFGAIQWPYPHALPVEQLTNFGYEDEVFLSMPFELGSTQAKVVHFSAEVDWLVCKVECVPGSAKLELSIPTSNTSQNSTWYPSIHQNLSRVPLPQPTSLRSTFEMTPKNFVLRVEDSENILSEYTQARFFPFKALQISNSKAQVFARHGKVLTLGLVPDENVGADIKLLDGVLWLGSAAGKPDVAYEILATQNTLSTSPLWLLCLLALAGGLILNLMPCVLPVLSLKVLALVKDQSHSAAKKRRQAWAYSAGVLVSFLLLSVLLVAVKAFGQELGWGFQLQNPIFVLYMLLLFYLLGLSLLGIFHLGERLMGFGHAHTQGKGYKASFFTGVLAVLVATPCTAPFMGVAIGSALTLGPLANLLIFAFLGAGMALPYLLLGHLPSAQRWIPKPGPWMERFKEFLAFPLFGTALWLLSVLAAQSDMSTVLLSLLLMLFCSFAIWLQKQGKIWNYIGSAILLAGLATPPLWLQSTQNVSDNSENTSAWKTFSPQAVEAELKNGHSVFVDYTALWCVTCQVNKKLVLEKDAVLRAFAGHNVRLFRADWTKKDAVITQSLAQLGRRSVPTYVLYSQNDSDPTQIRTQLLPEILSISLLQEVLQKLPKNKGDSTP